jgi:hypothetical protein
VGAVVDAGAVVETGTVDVTEVTDTSFVFSVVPAKPHETISESPTIEVTIFLSVLCIDFPFLGG